MSDFEPYYRPEECGLEEVATLGDGGGYDWDIALVWRVKETGRLVGWAGGGCSCYGPCDDVHSLSDLVAIDSAHDVITLADQVSDSYYTADERLQFSRDVNAALEA